MRGLKRRDWWIAFLFVLPVVVVLLSVSIFPMIYSFYLSLYKWDIGMGGKRTFIGAANYLKLFSDARFFNSLKNTGRVLLFGVGAQFGIGLSLALLLNRGFRGRNLVVTLFLLPMMISPVVVGCIWKIIYHYQYGPLNYLLNIVKIPSVNWLGSGMVSPYSIVLADIWEWTPFMVITLLAGLQAIPDDLYEAARVDGANRWQIFSAVVFPLLRPVVIIAILIRVMDAFKIFDLVVLLTMGGPGQSSESVAFYNYLTGFKYFSMGYASAMSYFQLVVIVIIANIFLRSWKGREVV
ncbi:MAG: carbohydrate ABC transporter permease [Candidatus Caldatribacteriaceae bacterium]